MWPNDELSNDELSGGFTGIFFTAELAESAEIRFMFSFSGEGSRQVGIQAPANENHPPLRSLVFHPYIDFINDSLYFN